MLSPYSETPFVIQLSFDQVIGDLEKIVENGSGERVAEAAALLQEVALYPEFREGITDDQQIGRHTALLRNLMKDYFPAALTMNEIKAVSIPYRNLVFNHSERFKNILNAAGNDFQINIRDFDEHQFYVLSCCLILNDYYGTQLDFGRPLFYDIPTANGIIKHYRIMYNADYMEILPTERSLPITPEDIDLLLDNYDNLDLWKEKFPQESWLLKGFAIMTLYDATVENAVSIFKEKLLVLNAVDFQESVESIFRSIYRIPDIRVGFTVFNQLEGKFSIADFGHKMRSFILPDDHDLCDVDALCSSSFQSLIQEKVYFAISDTADFGEFNQQSKLAKRLFAEGIRSVILAPVVKDNVLMGILELVSPRPKELNSISANKLEVVMPFLTDSLDRLIVDIQNQIQAFIQEKYTTIHKSVFWRFREEAQRALTNHGGGEETRLEEIVFPEVFPLYGQVDIKGSSDARNSSVQHDLRTQLKTLIALFKELRVTYGTDPFAEEEEQLNSFMSELQLPIRANTEQVINDYIYSRVHVHLKDLCPAEASEVIDRYFAENNKDTGSFHLHRREYEAAIAAINEKMAVIIDSGQTEAQLIFPHYYERFKTDGVEHNLYIGASIAPYREFDLKKLGELRLWQLNVLCEMERSHYAIKADLPYPLEVTTLILVYHTYMAIRFRMDEKRFDVDGSYNARFEIVKKRIDKAHIKDTDERITKTGMITIVYSGELEEEEYLRYIKLLQSQQILGAQIEIFDVEDLQGVSGLKALRVEIIHQ
jgi:hypothetical protein